MGQSECPVWIGANNWQLDDGSTAYLPSDGALAPFLVTDDADGNTENCVTLFGSVDYNCKCSTFRFLCEVRSDPPELPCRPDLSRKWVGVTDVCTVEYEAPQCPDECREERCECQTDSEIGNKAMQINGKVIDLIRSECLNWVEAQQYCCDLNLKANSRLYEPASVAEWNAVKSTLLSDVSIYCSIELII